MGFSLTGLSGNLGADPFFCVRLSSEHLEHLERELRECARRERQWFTLIATSENPRRLRLKEEATPDFEANASAVYLRGDVFRVSGREGRSCNVAFSSRAAADLCECIDHARARMREFVELRVPSRRRSLVEFIPDTDLNEGAPEEHLRLARSGTLLAGQMIEPEDFADWERLT